MIHVVIGTKAQLVKMAPVMLALQQRGVPYNFIFTGQHQETMDDLRENFSLKAPDVVLHRGKDVTSISMMFFWILRILFKTLFANSEIFRGDTSRASIVLVHGDTFSTLLGALMGKVARKRVAHVESGLRSFNLFHPFPEELTRLCTFRLTDIFYCPGTWALGNVASFRGEKIDTEYNTLMDALRAAVANFEHSKVAIPEHPYCVVTTHRFENIFNLQALEKNLKLVELVAEKMRVVFILHPVTERKLREFSLYDRVASNPRIEVRPRYDYFNFMRLVFRSEFVVSDGGSNQEECFYMGKPCLLLRQATERKEGLGVTTVLSNYDAEVVKTFVNEYARYRTDPRFDAASPSNIIVSHLASS